MGKNIDLNEYILVSRVYEDKLKENNIPFNSFPADEKYFIVKQGKKPKKFNEEQQDLIRKDLETLSIRKVAEKYNTSTRTIQDIKNNKY